MTVLVLLFSCNNSSKRNDQYLDKSKDAESIISYDDQFKEWLTNFNPNVPNIVDSTSERAFELWSYDNNLTKNDSMSLWFPSKDSSYFLITNYVKKTNGRLTKGYSDIELKFLDIKNKKVYLGIILLDSLKEREIDYYWYDSNTFYFSEKLIENDGIILTKLKMQVDSIWTYKIEI